MVRKISKKLPALPYNGGSGWSGSTASKERAEYMDASGITAKHQLIAFKAIKSKGTKGLTVHELEEFLPESHHGSRSGVLTNLHDAGHIVRLKERRATQKAIDGLDKTDPDYLTNLENLHKKGSHVYVAPEHVDSRGIDIPKPRVKRDTLLEALDIIEEYIQTDNLARAIWFIRTEKEKWDPKKKKKK